MKGIILAGGLGTRLYPLTHATNKHLLPVFDRPMIYYPIQTLVKAGITEVMIILSGPHAGHFISILKNGKEFGLKHLEYGYQDKPNGGICDAMSFAEDFADGESIMVVLGDNTTDADTSDAVNNFQKGSVAFLKQVENPERFGVAKFDENDKSKIIEIVEKPGKVGPGPAPSNYASTGLYIFDGRAFDIIKTLSPSSRGELEVTDLQTHYAKNGELTWHELKGYWDDCGSFETLYRANAYYAKKGGVKI